VNSLTSDAGDVNETDIILESKSTSQLKDQDETLESIKTKADDSTVHT